MNIIKRKIVNSYIFTKIRSFRKKSKIKRGKYIDLKFEDNISIAKSCYIFNSFIGYYTYICDNCVFYNSKIGRFCSIGNNVKVIVGKHPTKEFLSTNPIFYSTCSPFKKSFVNKDFFNEYSEKKYDGYSNEIGNDVWIGNNVLIIDGIKIGDGAIIGAGCVVSKNIPPYAIVVGCPCKIIGYRFENNVISKLQRLKWWEKDLAWIKNKLDLFTNYDMLQRFLVEEVKNE